MSYDDDYDDVLDYQELRGAHVESDGEPLTQYQRSGLTRSLLALQAAMARELERWPCGQCEQYHLCAERELACSVFARYVTLPPSGGYQRVKEDQSTYEPSRAQYLEIFHNTLNED